MKFYPNDTNNFLEKLTFRKLANALFLLFSYYFSKWSRNVQHIGKPMTISIEPTTACNLRCPECPSGLRSFTRPTGNLKKDFFKKVIHKMKDDLIYLIFYFQGEPYINPAFLEMVNYASKNNIYTITSTNAHFLDNENAKRTVQSGLDRLIISIDGTTQEVYEQYRKEGQLKTVLDGAHNVVKWKRKLKSATPHIIFQFLVVGPNEHQIDKIKIMAKEIGVDEVKLKTAQIYDYENGHPLIPKNEKYSRYRKLDNGKYRLKYEINSECWKMWHSAVITWDRKVVPCCFDKDADHQMGSLTNDSFEKIWRSETYDTFRKEIFSDRSSIDICTNCTEGCQVWKN